MLIQKSMIGLKQAEKLANNHLINHLNKFGYAPVSHTLPLWKYKSRPISFRLVVEDVGIKYVGKKYYNHLIKALRELYTLTEDEIWSTYIGLKIHWD